MREDLEILKRSLIRADPDAGVAAAQRLVDAGVDPKAILEEGMAVAMFELGEMWKRGEVFLPEVVASAEVFKRCNAVVEPVLLAQKDENTEPNALVVLATVKGDLHDLGKNMVGAMLRTSGFDVHDMGKDVSADKIVAAIQEMRPQIVGLSALLTTTVPYQETVIKRLVQEGLRDQVKVMVGGAPVTPEWAEKIQADGYANNAPEAVEVARKLVGLAQ
ncbi:MAG: cobalamin B12-binding domain-containing protein [Actinobacteria bacterium]|nr:cobalamin B12-binding domain-containing protein [Actinomycetota bacterium]